MNSPETIKKDKVFEEFIVLDTSLKDLADKYNKSCAAMYKYLNQKKLLKEDHMPKRYHALFPSRTCGYCGKTFIWRSGWSYKVNYKDMQICFHSYTCMQQFRSDLKLKEDKEV